MLLSEYVFSYILLNCLLVMVFIAYKTFKKFGVIKRVKSVETDE